MPNRNDTPEFHEKVVRLDRSLHLRLVDLAKRHDRSTLAEYRMALREYVDRHDEKAAA